MYTSATFRKCTESGQHESCSVGLKPMLSWEAGFQTLLLDLDAAPICDLSCELEKRRGVGGLA